MNVILLLLLTWSVALEMMFVCCKIVSQFICSVWVFCTVATDTSDKESVQVKLLCGSDVLESFAVPGLWSDEDVSYCYLKTYLKISRTVCTINSYYLQMQLHAG